MKFWKALMKALAIFKLVKDPVKDLIPGTKDDKIIDGVDKVVDPIIIAGEAEKNPGESK